MASAVWIPRTSWLTAVLSISALALWECVCGYVFGGEHVFKQSLTGPLLLCFFLFVLHKDSRCAKKTTCYVMGCFLWEWRIKKGAAGGLKLTKKEKKCKHEALREIFQDYYVKVNNTCFFWRQLVSGWSPWRGVMKCVWVNAHASFEEECVFLCGCCVTDEEHTVLRFTLQRLVPQTQMSRTAWQYLSHSFTGEMCLYFPAFKGIVHPE